MAKKKATKDYVFAVGRRKSSIARVRLNQGRGQTLVNSTTVEEYFKDVDASTKLWSKPFQVTKTEGKYWVSAKIAGGGKKGQLESLVHGIARALVATDSDAHRLALKKHGLLTRDSRTRERRKVGTGGKARRRKQSPKR
ncbi:MAG: 30S ribosomal protein S9 [Candidatus Blackburnbacteria bacterium RIFCSPHIGHO2_02_FULL_39_13]|uniref:30S ribosomal protein S9 n=1 Tax=Candidatus Blackburnbacteria bacterium RIFCSPLOWO2_01_FULL_40_20 TaxID=1797519 RepID=A0A1G1VDM4_9BACT|nr:MAG: 30S ribosomal protein S9 [Microgenomates group bacterium GW2011_GWA2_39_19]OGY07022.1 MAG: 30S ribosomal protein S9 [Candidatus Blackburnbacteria bacterium RIFCSPHIGHO2_01_FULL_40_17]OGY08535.1 MAG: 30S ribosomal protein S9 [Candidatus Blackburnbacteria bacterium RIFCSPHIGHO2_02_FULL_39_13]OGY13302.1 MAG: 30S ribosomal protein S9 [Candidatus Blackburnbacteria bacterium RIFCSPLOWO2_01_FULL_40_20]OGY14482.1 MAG: 30S ribosomal protein S9 [Candidatus Blackburnbacteria bacterium RIFCSPLOWO2_